MEKAFYQVVFGIAIGEVTRQSEEIQQIYTNSPDVLRLLLPEVKGRVVALTADPLEHHSRQLIRIAALCIVCAVSESLRAGRIDANE